MQNQLTEDQIIQALAESSQVKRAAMLAYLEQRYSGRFDKKIARTEAKRLSQNTSF